MGLNNAVGNMSEMNGWRARLRFDPLPLLLSSENDTLVHLVRRDLLGDEEEPAERI